ncbi:MAG: helix-turn-helix domain-containing protein [Candidatus Humimicrobiaceae bacterium]
MATVILISNKELMKRLNVTKNAIYKWRKKGMPVSKKGCHYVYNYGLVLEWLRQKKLKDPVFKALLDSNFITVRPIQI